MEIPMFPPEPISINVLSVNFMVSIFTLSKLRCAWFENPIKKQVIIKKERNSLIKFK